MTGEVRRERGELPLVILSSLQIPGDTRLSGHGSFAFADQSWTLRLQGDRWPFHPIEGEDLAFDVDMGGTPVRSSCGFLNCAASKVS